jgi:hypothetical protein
MTEVSASYADGRGVSIAKTLSDTGFERTSFVSSGWVRGASLSSPVIVYVRWLDDTIQLAVDDLSVLVAAIHAVGRSPGRLVEVPRDPSGVAEASHDGTSAPMATAEVAGLPELHDVLSAAFRATRGSGLLEPVRSFQIATAKLPSTTEAERLVVQRIGQDLFRRALFRKWNSRCPITGVDIPDLLRASHIKRWSRCDTDAERLDPDNGLLLAVQWDAAFDQGFVTFDDAGQAVFASALNATQRERLGLAFEARIPLTTAMRGYLTWHRTILFKDAANGRGCV